MYEGFFTLTAAIGSVALLFAIGLYRWHNEIELFGVIALFAWAVVAFGAGNLVVVDNGETFQFVSFPVQLLAAGLAAVSLFAILGAMTGKWPPKQGGEGPV